MYSLRGLGRTVAQDIECRAAFAGGFFMPSCWSALEVSSLAPPPAPPVDQWVTPPASGDDAQATVDAILNQEAIDQQKLNAAGVQSSWWDSITGGTYAAGAAVGDAAGSVAKSVFPWAVVAVAAGAFALVAIGGGSPRRYGR